jgi:hypothetical protein
MTMIAALVAACRGPGSQSAQEAAKQQVAANAAALEAVCSELQEFLQKPEAKVRLQLLLSQACMQ